MELYLAFIAKFEHIFVFLEAVVWKCSMKKLFARKHKEGLVLLKL